MNLVYTSYNNLGGVGSVGGGGFFSLKAGSGTWRPGLLEIAVDGRVTDVFGLG